MLGVCMALGLAFSSVKTLIDGDLSINLSGWCSQQLKLLLAYLSKMDCLSLGRFSGVGAQGNTGGVVGGNSLLGQLQVVSLGAGTPEFEHLVGLVVDWILPVTAIVESSHDPT